MKTAKAIIACTLIACHSLLLAAPKATQSTLQFTQQFHNHIQAFTMLLCEGIYSSRMMSDNLNASKTTSDQCYTLMLPIVEKHVHNLATLKQKRITATQMNILRDDIAHKATTDYLEQHIALVRPIYLDNYRKDFPIIFCRRGIQNAILKPIMSRITQAQCIAHIKPIIDQCITRYNSKIPEHVTYAGLHKYSYLIGSCCSIKFINFFINRHTPPSQ